MPCRRNEARTEAAGPFNLSRRALTLAMLVGLCGALAAGARPAAAQEQRTCVTPPETLANWYRAEGDATDARGTRHGTLAGGATFAAGQVGQAFSFDGIDDTFESTQTDVLNLPYSLTIEAWVRPALRTDGTKFPANVVNNRAISNQGFSGRGFGLNVFPEGSELRVMSGDLSRVVPNISFQAGIWYHVAVVYTYYDYKVYVNGQLVDHVSVFQTDHTPSGYPGDERIRIGWNRVNGIPPASTDFFKGQIDEVSLYAGALSAPDVAAIHAAGSAGKCPQQTCAAQSPTLANWYRAEGDANDTRGGQHGLLVNGVTFAAGKVEKAFELDGVDDYVRLPDNLFPAPATQADFSFEVWFRTRSGGVILGQQNSAALTTTPTGWIPALYVGTDGLLYAQPFFYQPQPPLTSNVLVNDGLYHHAVVTFNHGTSDLGTITLYLDGRSMGSKSGAQLDYASQYRYQLGTGYTQFWPAGNDSWYSFEGQLDEASSYSQALTPFEVTALFAAGGAGKCTGFCATPLPPAGLVSWYTGEGTREDVRGGLDAGPTTGVGFSPGAVGRAFNFDGVTSRLMIADNAAHKPLVVTLAGWVKFNTLDSFDDNNQLLPNGAQYLVFKKNSQEEGAAYALYKEAGTNRLAFRVTSANGASATAVWSEPVPAGEFFHFAASFDTTSARLYINGELVTAQEAAARQNLDYGNTPLFFGWSGLTNVKGRFTGLLDELQLYNRVLAATEIELLANAGRSGHCQSNPVSNNDNFANAQQLVGGYGRAADSNLTASREAGEPNHAGQTGGGSLWYRWTAPASGRMIFTTSGSDFDTLVGVYTGLGVGALTLVASNDDNTNPDNLEGHTLTSSVSFDAVAGTSYNIAVDGAGNRRGRFTLGWGADVTISGQLACGVPGGNLVACGQVVNIMLTGDDSRVDRLTPQLTSGHTYSFAHLRAGGRYRVALDFDGRGSHPNYDRPDVFNFPFLPGPISGLNFANPGGGRIDATVSAVGRVTNAAGAPLSGIPVTATGTANRTVLSDPSGYYTLTALPNNGNYTITPTHPLYTFTPPNRIITNINSDIVGADFNALDTYTIDGQVRDAAGTPLAGATLNLSGAQTATAQSDANGFYLFPVQTGGSYTVTVSRTGYVFAQPSRSFTNVTTHQKFVDFAGTLTSYTIGGRTTEGANALAGVTVTLSGTQAATAMTNAAGDYTFANLPGGGNYTVTPTRPNYNFTPPARTYNNLSANQPAADFTGTNTAALRLDTVAPAAGRTTGGQQLTLTGAFTNLAAVMVGGINAPINSSSATQVVVTTPAHAIGAVQIDLFPTSGTSYSKANAFAYLPTVFTDNTLVAGVTTAKAQHILELRQAIDALRAVAGLTPAPWTDPTLSPQATQLKAVHIMELRTVLEDVASRLGYGPGTYTDPSLAVGTQIKRVHIEELRQRIRNIAG